MCAQRRKTATLRVSCAMVFATLAFASVSAENSVASAAGLRDADAHIAYIFVDPRLTEKKKELNRGNVSRETQLYRQQGYEVRYLEGTERNILQAILNPKVAAITFIGEGGFGSGRKKQPASAPTLSTNMAGQWQDTVRIALQEKHDFATAVEMSRNFAFHRVANYSCYSAVNRSIANVFVRPGGEYWGTPKSYNASSVPWSTTLFGGDNALTKYGVQSAETESRNASLARQWAAIARAAKKRFEEGNQGRPELITKIE